jgi:fumarylacetoacetate (FAA) hydrolase family protein
MRSPSSDARILSDLQDAVTRMHVVAQEPRVVVAKGTRVSGARPMAWQVRNGFDSEPTLDAAWATDRLSDAMAAGPVLQAFRADRLPDDVAEALVGVLVFEEDGLTLDGVRAIAAEHGVK